MSDALQDILEYTDTTTTRKVASAVVRSVSETGAKVQLLSTREPAILPITEAPLGVLPKVGEHIQVLLLNDSVTPTVSLTHPELVSSMLAGVVPEIREQKVRIMRVSRLPGVRTKIAVAATDPDINPISVILGPGANRIKYLRRHLGQERIEVIPWHEDSAELLRNAFAPATVTRILVDPEYRLAAVSVPQHIMAAAVGAGGLNASLAGRLASLHTVVVPDGTNLEEALINLREELELDTEPADEATEETDQGTAGDSIEETTDTGSVTMETDATVVVAD